MKIQFIRVGKKRLKVVDESRPLYTKIDYGHTSPGQPKFILFAKGAREKNTISDTNSRENENIIDHKWGATESIDWNKHEIRDTSNLYNRSIALENNSIV